MKKQTKSSKPNNPKEILEKFKLKLDKTVINKGYLEQWTKSVEEIRKGWKFFAYNEFGCIIEKC